MEIQTTAFLPEKKAVIEELFREDALFFDIETTGFSPRTTHLYLIGWLTVKGHEAEIHQALIRDPGEERELLSFFLDQIRSFRRLITYNGVGFDQPYLEEKLKQYDLKSPFSGLDTLDLFKEIKGVKKVLNLPNYKQKTLEDWIGLKREDSYSGGDLIPVYRHYAATGDPLPKHLLLTHNREDLSGLLSLLPLLSYPRFFEGGFALKCMEIGKHRNAAGKEQEEMIFHLTPTYPFPVPLRAEKNGLFLKADENEALLSLPVLEGSLKFFFPDPENYYYLPEEDLAVHKSVGEFVEKSHRKKATRQTAFTRMQGRFLPQPEEIFRPAFREAYRDKSSFFLLEEDLMERPEVPRYLCSCLKGFLK